MSLFDFIFLLIPVLISGGFFTLFERKVMGSVQEREGPSKVIVLGFFQPFSDALKLFMKTNLSSEVSVDFVYFLCPLVSFFLSMMGVVILPVVWGVMSWYSSILFLMFCFSVSVYGVIMSGWFSRSKFASLGCIRALSQSVSYEIPLSVVLMVYMLVFSSFSLSDISDLQSLVLFVFPFFYLFIIMFIVFLAEMNRSPFDLAEGESELVSGFSVELGGSSFVLVFLSEYVALVVACMLMSLFFGGKVDEFFGFKVVFFMFLFVLVRASVPRIRYDHVMIVCWSILLPLVVSFLLFCVCFLFNQSQSGGMLLLKVLLTSGFSLIKMLFATLVYENVPPSMEWSVIIPCSSNGVCLEISCLHQGGPLWAFEGGSAF